MNLTVEYTLINGNRSVDKAINNISVNSTEEEQVYNEAKQIIADYERVPVRNIKIRRWIESENHLFER